MSSNRSQDSQLLKIPKYYSQLSFWFNQPWLWVSLVTGLLVLFAAFSWPVADDFCNFSTMREQGITEYTWKRHLEWTGRISTSPLLWLVFQTPNLFWLPLWSVVMVLLFVWWLYQVLRWLLPDFSKTDTAWILIAIPILLWWGTGKVLGEIIIWVSGSVRYFFPLIFLLLYGLCLRKITTHRQTHGLKHYFLLSILGFLAGSGMEMSSFVLIIFNFLWITWKWRATKKIEPIYLFGFFGVFIGTLTLFLAPGNFKRATMVNHTTQIPELLSQTQKLSTRIYSKGTTLWKWKSLLLGLLSFTVSTKKIISKKILQKGALTFIFGGLGLIPLLPVESVFGLRAQSYFWIFFWISAVLISIGIKSIFLGTYKISLFKLGLVAIILFWMKNAGDELVTLSQARQKLIHQHEKLVQTSKAAVIIEPMNYDGIVKNHKLSQDSGGWVNRCVAKYYQLDSITTR